VRRIMSLGIRSPPIKTTGDKAHALRPHPMLRADEPSNGTGANCDG